MDRQKLNEVKLLLEHFLDNFDSPDYFDQGLEDCYNDLEETISSNQGATRIKTQSEEEKVQNEG